MEGTLSVPVPRALARGMAVRARMVDWLCSPLCSCTGAMPAQGLCFDCQILDSGALPMDPHDFPMHVLVTPTRVFDCRKGAVSHHASR
jgi:hypothetical protein